MGSGYRELGLPDRSAVRAWCPCARRATVFFRGQDIAVVGGGDSAVEEATFLAGSAARCRSHRRDTVRPSKIMQERRSPTPGGFTSNSAVASINGIEVAGVYHAARHRHRRHPGASSWDCSSRWARAALRAGQGGGRRRRQRLRAVGQPDGDELPSVFAAGDLVDDAAAGHHRRGTGSRPPSTPSVTSPCSDEGASSERQGLVLLVGQLNDGRDEAVDHLRELLTRPSCCRRPAE